MDDKNCNLENLNLNDAVLIVAHPDDEILWFSSVLQKVNRIIICFIENPGRPDWTEGRKKSLKQYPLSNMTTLDVAESEVFNLLNWQNQEYDRFGLKLHSKGDKAQRYKKNYQILRERLLKAAQGYRTVISHNPWGEYGNEEHVQIHLVLKDIQKTLDFELWWPNYVSNKSWELMQSHRSGLGTNFIELPTQVDLAHNIYNIYLKNGCWTWYNTWQWCAHEGFFKASDKVVNEIDDIGYVHPYNLIRVTTAKMRYDHLDRKRPLQRINNRISKIMRSFRIGD